MIGLDEEGVVDAGDEEVEGKAGVVGSGIDGPASFNFEI
jgi:hypothetical protein